jgi:hypothetical protein
VSLDGGTRFQSRGFRGTREYADDPPAGALRIVVCGDSFTFCQEVDDDAAWPRQLEELWPEAEVPNLGVGGYGTDQALLRFRRDAPRGRIDAALVGLLLENVGRNVNRYRPLWYPNADSPAVKPRFVVGPAGALELVPQPFETRAAFVDAVEDGTILERVAEHEYWSARYVPPGLGWSALARLLGARRAYAERDLARLWSRTDDEPFRTTLAILSAFVGEATGPEHGAGFAGVLVFPTREDLAGLAASGERYWGTLLRALDERGIAWLDLSEPLARALAEGSTLDELYVQSHLSPAGNGVVARTVHDWLRDDHGVR